MSTVDTTKNKQAPLIGTSVAALLFIPVMFILGSSIVQIVTMQLGIHPTDKNIVGVVSAIAGELLAIGYIVMLGRKYGSHWKETLFLSRPTAKTILYGVVAGAAVFALLKIVAIALYLAGAPIGSSDTSSGLAGMTGLSKILVVGIIVPFIVPVFEELVCRGAATSALLGFSQTPSHARTAWAVFGSSLLFTIAHYQGMSDFMDFFTLGWIFLVALVDSFVRFTYQSIFVAIACHSTYNLLTAISILLIR